MTAGSRTRVLFVCHGNLCRSPLAEGIFRRMLRERGLEDAFEVDSAGTWGLDAQPPHPLSCRIAAEHGFELTGRSRAVEPEDPRAFDHILVMDRRNLADMERYRGLSASGSAHGVEAVPRLLRAVCDPDATGADLDVEDPIGGGIADYARVYDLLDRCLRVLLDELAGPSP